MKQSISHKGKANIPDNPVWPSKPASQRLTKEDVINRAKKANLEIAENQIISLTEAEELSQSW